MLNCRNVTRLVSEAQERRLSFLERFRLRRHLGRCEGCQAFSVQVPWLSRLMHEHAQGRDERAVESPGSGA